MFSFFKINKNPTTYIGKKFLDVIRRIKSIFIDFEFFLSYVYINVFIIGFFNFPGANKRQWNMQYEE